MRTILFSLTALTVLAQDSLPIRHTFEEDTSGWVVMGSAGKVTVTHEPAQVKTGRGAMSFQYELKSNGFTSAVAPMPGGLTGMRRMRFWVKTDHDTAVAVLLSEKKPNGGNYTTWVWAPANTWQQIDLAPEDFAASDGPADPVDRDGKLDLDQVEGVGIIDLAYFFNMIPRDLPLAVARSSGSHTLFIDDFEVVGTGQKRAASGPIDAFDRGFLQWVTLGGMNLKLDGHSLQASYERSASQLGVLTRRASEFDLAKATRLALDLSSEREATIVITIELKKPESSEGPRYAATVYPPPGRQPLHVDLKFSDFEHDENSPAGPPKVDPSKIKMISVIDLTAMAGGDGGTNTIWISSVRAN